MPASTGRYARCFGAASLMLATACSGALETPSGPAGPGADQEGQGSSTTAFRLPMLRLSRTELDLTLADTLEDATNPAQRVLSEQPFTPFDRDVATQEPSAALIDSLQALAEDVTQRLLADGPRFQRVVGCALAAGSDAACFDGFVARQVPLMYRRVFSAAELQRYRTLWDLAGQAPASLGPRIGEAVALVLESVLQDPEFLYRIEHGGGSAHAQALVTLSAHEVATRLAFWIWGRPPDAMLLAAASEGRLNSGEDRKREATRLLADPRARAHWRRYHAMWLGYRTIPHEAALVASFQQETDALVDRVLFEPDRDYFDLFRSEETFVSSSLATHYGLPAPATDPGWVTYPEASGRKGLLAHGSVLSAFSKFNDTSPTQRGIFVRERLMCWPVGSAPAVVDVDQPPRGDTEDACKAERYRAHGESSGCAGCHAQIDPIGFGLERFDMAGRPREHDDGAPACTIEGVGNLPMQGPFEGPAELAELLLASGELIDCAPRFLLEYLWGRKLGSDDEAAAGELSATFGAVDHRFGAWLIALVGDPRFVLRQQNEVSP